MASWRFGPRLPHHFYERLGYRHGASSYRGGRSVARA
ncbi:unnamed protein product [Chondrus crispus]|uniref:Uncharacterized protein n=1 Tax=Chondrus crispus TaxID=2769 RepID=R7Q9X2_CHOCR|nr:unnamed protein product [Chondrus crispus]CDF34270.1 unnamed protein product [Chondrus crispus]|eukprot:XP_005714089.1 unnamed protein product [Chondrus crispus]